MSDPSAIDSPLYRLEWAAAAVADQRVCVDDDGNTSPFITEASARLIPVLAKIINAKTGCCFHSVAKLATLSGQRERAARRGLRKLEVSGWLLVEKTGGRRSNTYRLTMPDPATRTARAGLTRTAGAGLVAAEGESQPGTAKRPTRHRESINPARTSIQPGPAVPPIKGEQDSEQVSEQEPSTSIVEDPPALEDALRAILEKIETPKSTAEAKSNTEFVHWMSRKFGSESLIDEASRQAASGTKPKIMAIFQRLLDASKASNPKDISEPSWDPR